MTHFPINPLFPFFPCQCLPAAPSGPLASYTYMSLRLSAHNLPSTSPLSLLPPPLAPGLFLPLSPLFYHIPRPLLPRYYFNCTMVDPKPAALFKQVPIALRSIDRPRRGCSPPPASRQKSISRRVASFPSFTDYDCCSFRTIDYDGGSDSKQPL